MTELPGTPADSAPFNLFTYFTFLTIGISYLWPWNAFLSATTYFFVRLSHHPYLQASVASSLMLISTLTSTSIFIYLVRYPQGSYSARIGYGEVIIAASFLILAISCVAGTNISQVFYFLFVLVVMLMATFGASIVQNGSFAIVGLFSSIYMQGIMVGQAVAGILPPLVSIVSEVSAIKAKAALRAQGATVPAESMVSWSSFWPFVVSSVIAMAALGLYYMIVQREPGKFQGDTRVLPFPPFSNDHDYQMISENDVESLEEEPVTIGRSASSATLNISSPLQRVPVKSSPMDLFRKLKAPSLTVLLVFTASLLFPVFLQVVQPVNSPETSILFEPKIFAPLGLFVWNLGDLLGRLVCGRPEFVVTGQRTMVAYAVLRFLFVPLYFLCNLNGHGGILHSDFLYMTIHFFFGLTNGQLGTSAMMVSGDYVGDDEKESAGSFMVMMLSFGLTLGSFLSFGLVALVHPES